MVDSLMMGTDCLLAGHAFCVTVLALVKKHVYGLFVLVKNIPPVQVSVEKSIVFNMPFISRQYD